MSRLTIDELVAEARAQITRCSPAEAQAAVAGGALIVDIRADDARARDGIVPGSLHLPRTVLEWRVAPEGTWRNPHVGGLDRELVLICDHGYSSSLAAATLVRLGFSGAGDVIGGFEAWVAAGLPVSQPSRPRPPGQLPGLAPPDP
jgi:rhodanese-related sulfurtransferase